MQSHHVNKRRTGALGSTPKDNLLPQRDLMALQSLPSDLCSTVRVSGKPLLTTLCKVATMPTYLVPSPVFSPKHHTHTHTDTYLSASASPCQNVSPNRDKLSTFAEGPTWLPTPPHISILKD